MTKKKMGAPSKINETAINFAAYLASEGKTDEEIAEKLKVSVRTVYNWKKSHPDFFQVLKAEKAKADADVEKSLYERACGYSHPEIKVFCQNGQIVTHEVMKYYPPDPTSMIFWLKNRQSKNWRDKVAIEFDDIEEMDFGD